MSRQTIGPLTQDEVPVSPLQYRFDDVDLTSYTTAVLRVRYPDGTVDVLTATIDTPTNAAGGDTVTHLWDTGDLDQTGVYRAEFWLDDELASEPIIWYCRPAIIEVSS